MKTDDSDLLVIEDASNGGRSGIQFQLSTIFILTFIATIMAAFLNPRGSDLLLAGTVTVMANLGFALAVGKFRPPLADRVFWGIVVTAMMQVVCATVTLLDRSGIYAWPILAGFAAVIAAGNACMYRRMVWSSVMAGSLISIYVLALAANEAAIAYIICAAIGGCLLAIMVTFIRWAERRFRIPQPAIGLTMVLAAIGFSQVAPQVIPGW